MSTPEFSIKWDEYFNKTETAIIVLNMNGVIVDANKSAENHFQYTKRQLQKFDISDFDIYYTSRRANSSIENLKSLKSSIVNTTHKRKDGRLVEVTVLTTILNHSNEDYFIAHIYPSKNSIKGDRYLKTVHDLMISSKELMLIANADSGQLLFVNDIAISELKLENNKIHTYILEDIFHPLGENAAKCLNEIKNNLMKSHVCVVKTANDEIKKYSVKSSFISSGTENFILLNLARYNNSVSLDPSYLAQQKFTDMARLMSNISHHWRQPLNVINLLVEDLYEQLDEGELSQGYLELCKMTLQENIKELSENIDIFSQLFISNNKEKDFNIIKEIEKLIRLFKVQFEIENVEYILSCKCSTKNYSCAGPAGFPDCANSNIVINGDISKFRQILINVINNAFESIMRKKRSAKNYKPKLEIKLKVSIAHIDIFLVDNGEGIPSEFLESVFDPYFTTKPIDRSAGLGLFISKALIEKHFSGSIILQSASTKTVCQMSFTLKNKTISI